ncbi:MAG: dihydrolipoyl dehydrogenase [Thermodesulfobacteriota bacterium]
METIHNKKFDLIIIGSGPGGYVSAILSAQKGLSVALIEKGDLGGTCLNRGCIPTKTLLHESSLWYLFNQSGLIQKREEVNSYFKKTMEKKDLAIRQVVSGLQNLLARDPITLFHGEASFHDPKSVVVKRGGEVIERLEAPHILIASGAIPKEIETFKRDGNWIIGSDDLLVLEEIPSSIAIIGGGRRGVEFATFFNHFGVPVTLIERENRILPKMDREISVRYKGILTRNRVKVFTDTEVVSTEIIEKNRSILLTLNQKGKMQRLEVQKVLVVAERKGDTEGLDLSNASVALKGDFISVDSFMKTSMPTIYAVGDVVGRGFYAHKAFYEGKVAINNILGKGSQVNYLEIPICLYGYPEVSSVGVTEEEALKKYGDIQIGKFPFMACGRAISEGNQEGMVKIISEKKYGEVLGIHILGPMATELIHLGVMAIKHEIGVEDLKELIFAHPTFSEAFFEAALDTYGEALHMIKG